MTSQWLHQLYTDLWSRHTVELQLWFFPRVKAVHFAGQEVKDIEVVNNGPLGVVVSVVIYRKHMSLHLITDRTRIIDGGEGILKYFSKELEELRHMYRTV